MLLRGLLVFFDLGTVPHAISIFFLYIQNHTTLSKNPLYIAALNYQVDLRFVLEPNLQYISHLDCMRTHITDNKYVSLLITYRSNSLRVITQKY